MPKFPKIQAPEPDFRTIDLDQQDAVIQKINDPMDRAYNLFTAREMVRPSETRALCWDDLDFKHDRVVIRRHFSLNELRETTKSKRMKVLPLDGEIKEALLRLPRHIKSPFVFQRTKDERRSHIFPPKTKPRREDVFEAVTYLKAIFNEAFGSPRWDLIERIISSYCEEVLKGGNIESWYYNREKQDFKYWTIDGEDREKFILDGLKKEFGDYKTR